MAKILLGLSANILEKLQEVIVKSNEQNLTDFYKDLLEISKKVEELDHQLKNLNFESEQNELKPEEVGLGGERKLKELGKGKFGIVYKSGHKGCPVAVKLQKTDKQGKIDFHEESQMLKSFRHPNIIGYRGSGIYNGEVFIVMEYIEITLKEYIKSTVTDDGSGLSAFLTWHISQQIANGMDYLHSQGYQHGDLRPENVLLDTKPLWPVAKLCDFGLSCHSRNVDKTTQHHVRWYAAPEGWNTVQLRDVFAFGLIVVMLRTGQGPWDKTSTMYLESEKKHETRFDDETNAFYIDGIPITSDSVGGKLNDLIRYCCGSWKDQPTFQLIVKDHLSGENPFRLKEDKGEFFSCGFLTNTSIFVADSVVKEDDPQQAVSDEERFAGPKPTYTEDNLLCSVSLNPEENEPVEEELHKKFKENKKLYVQKAKDKEIDNNPNIALKKMILDRAGEDEVQHIELRYKQSTYCHHRAIRDIWRGFDEMEKNKTVPCKDEVHTTYSTSFGLHVAVLTKEEDGKRKFVFTQRSRAKGVASPGAYTCGAVESCSVKDYVEKKGDQAKVSLLRTAARGLIEELGLTLDSNDEKAIHLNTVYLKFDTHEWGMCGFIDLNDERIHPDHQLNFEQVKTAFTSAAKDKFEHSSIEGVDFELKTMVEWIREHHDQMASSGKIAVVKVLQAYYGTALVSKEFGKYVPK